METLKGKLVKKGDWELRYRCKACGRIIYFINDCTEKDFDDEILACKGCGKFGKLLNVYERGILS